MNTCGCDIPGRRNVATPRMNIRRHTCVADSEKLSQKNMNFVGKMRKMTDFANFIVLLSSNPDRQQRICPNVKLPTHSFPLDEVGQTMPGEKFEEECVDLHQKIVSLFHFTINDTRYTEFAHHDLFVT